MELNKNKATSGDTPTKTLKNDCTRYMRSSD